MIRFSSDADADLGGELEKVGFADRRLGFNPGLAAHANSCRRMRIERVDWWVNGAAVVPGNPRHCRQAAPPGEQATPKSIALSLTENKKTRELDKRRLRRLTPTSRHHSRVEG